MDYIKIEKMKNRIINDPVLIKAVLQSDAVNSIDLHNIIENARCCVHKATPAISNVVTLLNIPTSESINKLFPIPAEYDSSVAHMSILFDYSKAFYYDKDFNLLCEVSRKDDESNI